MDRPKRFIECTIPVTVCNIECPYCYVIQENRRSMKLAELKYPPSHIAKALRKERLGGICLINICGSGETFAQKEVNEIVPLLLKEGHYVNVTTNGTLSKRIRALVDSIPEYINHLHFSFSFHYTELVKHHLLNEFFSNIKYVREKGASFVLQFNLCDEYLPYLDEIRKLSIEHVGALPQVALTRDELSTPLSFYSKMSFNDYKKQEAHLIHHFLILLVRILMSKELNSVMQAIGAWFWTYRTVTCGNAITKRNIKTFLKI